MSVAKKYPIIEIYGPVIQGEGAVAGHQTLFVRFGGCDYRCSWCDSLYAVLPEEVKKNATFMTAEEIWQEVVRLGPHCPWVTLSGGNPAIHDLTELVRMLQQRSKKKVCVETQGSIFRMWLADCDLVTLSPKPPSSGMETNWDVLDKCIEVCKLNAVLKVVVFDDRDFEYAKSVHLRYPAVPFYLQVGNSVGQDNAEALLRKLEWLWEKTIADPDMADVVVLPQLHVLVYGNKRGI